VAGLSGRRYLSILVHLLKPSILMKEHPLYYTSLRFAFSNGTVGEGIHPVESCIEGDAEAAEAMPRLSKGGELWHLAHVSRDC